MVDLSEEVLPIAHFSRSRIESTRTWPRAVQYTKSTYKFVRSPEWEFGVALIGHWLTFREWNGRLLHKFAIWLDKHSVDLEVDLLTTEVRASIRGWKVHENANSSKRSRGVF